MNDTEREATYAVSMLLHGQRAQETLNAVRRVIKNLISVREHLEEINANAFAKSQVDTTIGFLRGLYGIKDA